MMTAAACGRNADSATVSLVAGATHSTSSEGAARMGQVRRTKIVCTIGPASADEATLGRLIDAGMNVARLNMSHGDQAGHAAVLARIRRCAAERGAVVAVLVDLQGPKMRTGPLADGGPVTLAPDTVVELTTQPGAGTATRITTSYAPLPSLVRPGDRILLSDGLIELKVEAVRAGTITCAVVTGGRLYERQGINLPGVTPDAPSLTEKDVADLRWAVAHRADYVAVSFVRQPRDVEAARAVSIEAGVEIPIIAKLEKPQALEQLGGILAVSDGVMIARGDMGVELPPEQVPVWQKRIIAAAAERLIPVITATQMLESMTHSTRPTRAEAADVANAIWDGTDAVMLSAETAAGEYPVEAVSMMDRIARAAEAAQAYAHPGAPKLASADFPHAIARATRALCESLPDVAAVVAFTRNGPTARLLSKDRPPRPIVALTDDPVVLTRMALYWGVAPQISGPAASMTALLEAAERAARDAGVGGDGDAIVVTGHLPPEAPGSTNFVMLHRLGSMTAPSHT
jgi:pyruvate kinase